MSSSYAEDGSMSAGLPLAERRSALEDFGRKDCKKAHRHALHAGSRPAISWLDDFDHGGRDGVCLKRLNGSYLSGEGAMIKVKRLQTADCAVVGFSFRSDGAEVGSCCAGTTPKANSTTS
jgi:ATP-dependent DNA ligase